MGEMLDTLAAASPLGRANEPGEVAHVIGYLAGEQARPITGTVLVSPAVPAQEIAVITSAVRRGAQHIRRNCRSDTPLLSGVLIPSPSRTGWRPR